MPEIASPNSNTNRDSTTAAPTAPPIVERMNCVMGGPAVSSEPGPDQLDQQIDGEAVVHF